MCITETLEKHEEEMKKFRNLLFPFIAAEVITGFNVYENQEPFSGIPIVVSHLHTELDEGKSYRLELERHIKNCCNTYEVQKVRFEKIDRHTAYKLLEDWEADEYYDSFGNPISGKELEDVLTAGRTVIGGGIQSDMRIALESVEQLYAIIDELRLHFNKFKINKESGLINYKQTGLAELNPDAIAGSWEVPVVLVKSDLEIELGDAYPSVTEVKIQKPEYFLDILVHKKEKQLRQLLSRVSLNLVSTSVNANRLFVEYIDGELQINK